MVNGNYYPSWVIFVLGTSRPRGTKTNGKEIRHLRLKS
jgi:hypothetical protein